MKTYELVVIGAGPGGYVGAIRAAQLGLSVAVVDDNPALGGTCLRVGCIPSKALLESSELFAEARDHFAEHGIGISSPTLDLEAMMTRKERIVSDLTNGVGLLMKKNSIDVFTGRGVLSDRNRVTVKADDGEHELVAKHVLLAMGSVPVELPFLPFDGERVVSSTEALAFTKVPRHLVVIGGGAIGLEMGSVWRRLGADVTVVEMLPRIAPFADAQISKQLQRALQSQGMEFRLAAKVSAAEVLKTKVKLTVEPDKGETEQVDCDRVLVSVGRRPASRGCGLEEIGVEVDGGGRVVVDSDLRTTVPGVFAIGDLVSGPMLAHKASEEAVAVAEHLAGMPGHVNYDTIPSVVYTDPELAMVGRTEEELKERGVPYSAGRYYFKPNGRAKAMGHTDGLVKILAHADTDRILGVHMLGPRVSELISEAVTAMEFAASAEDLARICHAHPTLSEVVHEAALAVEKRAIHG